YPVVNPCASCRVFLARILPHPTRSTLFPYTTLFRSVFTDKISGKSRAKRQALAELLDYIRDDDTVRIASMDRLGRDTRDLYNIVAEMTDKGTAVEFVSENITVDRDGASPLDSLMLGILAAFAEFERKRIRE